MIPLVLVLADRTSDEGRFVCTMHQQNDIIVCMRWDEVRIPGRFVNLATKAKRVTPGGEVRLEKVDDAYYDKYFGIHYPHVKIGDYGYAIDGQNGPRRGERVENGHPEEYEVWRMFDLQAEAADNAIHQEIWTENRCARWQARLAELGEARSRNTA